MIFLGETEFWFLLVWCFQFCSESYTIEYIAETTDEFTDETARREVF